MYIVSPNIKNVLSVSVGNFAVVFIVDVVVAVRKGVVGMSLLWLSGNFAIIKFRVLSD